jgi:hypothetical protein
MSKQSVKRLLQRHGYATPAQVRAAYAPVAEAA